MLRRLEAQGCRRSRRSACRPGRATTRPSSPPNISPSRSSTAAFCRVSRSVPARTATASSMRWRRSWSTSTARASTGATARLPTRCSVATATRSRRISSTPRRARSIRPCRTASAPTTSTSWSKTSASDSPTSAPCRAATDAFEDAVEAAESVRQSYRALWSELHDVRELSSGDRQAIRARIRRLNDLGFAVDEISLSPTSSGESVALRVAVAGRRFHARELAAADRTRRARGSGAPATERPARIPGLARARAGFAARARVAPPTLARRRPRSPARRSCARHRARPRPDPGVLRRARGEVAPVRGRPATTSVSRLPSAPICRSGLPRPRSPSPSSRSTSTGAGFRRRPE